MSPASTGFSEKDFYLSEFSGRSIGLVLPADPDVDWGPLESVLAELAGNGTRSVLFSSSPAVLERVAGVSVDPDRSAGWMGALWHALSEAGRAGVLLAADDPVAQCGRLVLRMRLAKLVWLDPGGALRTREGERRSVVAREDLPVLIDALASKAPQRRLLEEIGALLGAGLPSVNLCSLEGLAEELFTYAGSGTFFPRERYAEVRALALDEFSAAADLIARGVAEGYLAPRTPAQVEAVLNHGFGVFIEGLYLAGIGALEPYTTERVAEITSLYTVTRFAGEGVGSHLVGFAVDLARDQGFERVFACTTSQRVEGFFLRQGFTRIDPSAVPPSKWKAYPDERRARVICMGSDLLEAP